MARSASGTTDGAPFRKSPVRARLSPGHVPSRLRPATPRSLETARIEPVGADRGDPGVDVVLDELDGVIVVCRKARDHRHTRILPEPRSRFSTATTTIAALRPLSSRLSAQARLGAPDARCRRFLRSPRAEKRARARARLVPMAAPTMMAACGAPPLRRRFRTGGGTTKLPLEQQRPRSPACRSSSGRPRQNQTAQGELRVVQKGAPSRRRQRHLVPAVDTSQAAVVIGHLHRVGTPVATSWAAERPLGPPTRRQILLAGLFGGGTIAGGHRRRRRCGPWHRTRANALSTDSRRSGRRGPLGSRCWGLLKQPDKHKSAYDDDASGTQLRP